MSYFIPTQNQPPEVYHKKGVLKNLLKQDNNLRQSLRSETLGTGGFLYRTPLGDYLFLQKTSVTQGFSDIFNGNKKKRLG